MLVLGIWVGIAAVVAAEEIIGRIGDFLENRRPKLTLDELNEINRVLYAEDRAQLAENLRQIRG